MYSGSNIVWLRAPPDVGLAPSAAWRALPHPPPLGPRTPPPHQPGPPLRSIAKRARGVGPRGRERVGREGCGLREGSSSCNGGRGGGTLQRGVGAGPTSGGSRWLEFKIIIFLAIGAYLAIRVSFGPQRVLRGVLLALAGKKFAKSTPRSTLWGTPSQVSKSTLGGILRSRPLALL